MIIRYAKNKVFLLISGLILTLSVEATNDGFLPEKGGAGLHSDVGGAVVLVVEAPLAITPYKALEGIESITVANQSSSSTLLKIAVANAVVVQASNQYEIH